MTRPILTRPTWFNQTCFNRLFWTRFNWNSYHPKPDSTAHFGSETRYHFYSIWPEPEMTRPILTRPTWFNQTCFNRLFWTRNPIQPKPVSLETRFNRPFWTRNPIQVQHMILKYEIRFLLTAKRIQVFTDMELIRSDSCSHDSNNN